jgi:hypothetical protein
MPNDQRQRLKQGIRLGTTLIMLVGMLTWIIRHDPSPTLRDHALLLGATISLSIVVLGIFVQALAIAITGRTIFRDAPRSRENKP